MWFTSLLGNRQRLIPKSHGHQPPRKQPTYRPRLEILEDRWLPSQIGLTVTSLADYGPGTLRAAIQTADVGSPSDKFSISFGVTGTIDLQSPLPDLKNSIGIKGPGANSLTVERAAGFSFVSAIVTLDAGQTASLSGLTIANGNAGGIFNNGGTLTLANCAVLNNSQVFGPLGGGITNAFETGATLRISGCLVSGNSATEGAGISNALGDTLTVSDSYVCGNTAGRGGGILNVGTLTVDRSMVSNNTATGFDAGFSHFLGEGGGILNDGTMTVSGSTLCGNSADLGGGIFSDGTPTTVRNCAFTGNSATRGGGIYFGISPGLLAVQGSTFSHNTASDSGGGIYNLGTATLQECSLSKNSAGSAGGGIFNGASATLTVKDSTVLNNVAPNGADIYNLGALTLDDSTVGVIGP
jgi:predicted outer membrane repeat protein